MERCVLRLLARFLTLAALGACTTPSAPTWPIPEGASTQVVNGYPLTYRSRGFGPIVVFVPGVLTDYRVCESTLAGWEANYRVITVSPRHFFPERWDGRGTDFTFRQHAKDLDAFLETLPGPIYLVGWSFGGRVAFDAARARPDLVRKLVLVEAPLDALVTTPDAGQASVRQRRAEATAKFFNAGDIDGGLAYAIDDINGPGAWAATPQSFRPMLRDNAWTVAGIREEPERVTCADFASLKVPVLLVRGELTTPYFKRIVEEQGSCLPQAKTATIPKAGHASPLLNPPAFKEAVTSFLQP